VIVSDAPRGQERRTAAEQDDGGGYRAAPEDRGVERASGFTMHSVAEVLGHQKGDLGLSMTSGYAGRETMEA